MEEELIYLEPDEEITAIIDRVRESAAGGIRLVVPKGALVLQSLVSLKLLAREAGDLGKAIALVTNDPIAQHLAQEANLTVYAKPKDGRPMFAGRLPARLTPVTARDHPTPNAQHPSGSPAVSVPEEPEELPPGIPVHRYDRPDEPAADHPPLPAGRPDQRPPAKPIIRQALSRPPFGRRRAARIGLVLAALLGVGLLGWLAFLELYPRAAIALTLATEPLEQTVTVKASTQLPQSDLANAQIPASRKEVSVTVDKDAPATGKKDIGTKATVSVTLNNYWDSNPQTIAAGTGFRAGDGTPFVATETVTIPGATTTLSQGKVVTTPGTVNTILQAESPGTDANGKSGTFTIPSLPAVRQDKIYGSAVNPSAGGTSQPVAIVTPADLDTLKNASHDALLVDGKTKLTDGTSDRLLDGAIAVTVTSEQASAAADTQADTLHYHLVGTVKALFVTDANLKDATAAILSRAIPSGRTLVLRENDSLTATAQNLAIDAGTVDIHIAVKSRTAANLDLGSLAGTLTGLPIAEAQTRLRATAGVTDATVTNRPRWLNHLPKRAGQITITTEYATP